MVYADLNRLIICSNKFNLEDSVVYMKYLMSNLQNKELFSTVHIEMNKVWSILLWQDAANYGGIKINIDEENKVF